jgi:N-acetylneuraminate synthase
MTITLRSVQPIEADAKQIMEWRNDPITLADSFNSEQKVWESFWTEFRNEYFDTRVPPPVFGLDGELPLGFLRYRFIGDSKCDISINLAPEFRGKGLAVPLLLAGARHAKDFGTQEIVAEIKRENSASHKAFSRAGYALVHEGDVFQYRLGLV